jgi:hypothetical protein
MFYLRHLAALNDKPFAPAHLVDMVFAAGAAATPLWLPFLIELNAVLAAIASALGILLLGLRIWLLVKGRPEGSRR